MIRTIRRISYQLIFCSLKSFRLKGSCHLSSAQNWPVVWVSWVVVNSIAFFSSYTDVVLWSCCGTFWSEAVRLGKQHFGELLRSVVAHSSLRSSHQSYICKKSGGCILVGCWLVWEGLRVVGRSWGGLAVCPNTSSSLRLSSRYTATHHHIVTSNCT